MVQDDTVLRDVVSDKRVVFGHGCHVGEGESAPSQEAPNSLRCGATIVGMDARLPPSARVGKNCIIHPEVGEFDLTGPVPSGRSVRIKEEDPG